MMNTSRHLETSQLMNEFSIKYLTLGGGKESNEKRILGSDRRAGSEIWNKRRVREVEVEQGWQKQAED
jgi:hypothetical protein